MDAIGLWDSVWISLLTSAMLYGTYRAVEWRWPERYIGMTQTFGLSSQETLLRFIAYRCGPTFIFAATCFVTVDRVNGFPWISAFVLWFTSVALTHGRVVLQNFTRRWGEANYAAYHFGMTIGLGAVVCLAVWAMPAWRALVPSPDDLLSSLWSGLLVAGIGGFAVQVLRPRPEGSAAYDEAYFVDRATRDVGVETFDWLHAECVRTGANPVLLKAILVAEAVQRPQWTRTLERFLVVLRIARTSGVMQMTSRRPLTDRESVTQAAEAYAGRWGLRVGGPEFAQKWELDLGDTWGTVTRHNGDINFAKSVNKIGQYLLETVSGDYVARGLNEPIVLELRRYAQKFALRGISNTLEVSVVEVNGVAKYSTLRRPIERDDGSWWAWECEVSTSARRVVLVDRSRSASTVVHIEGGEVVLVDIDGRSQPFVPVEDPERA